MRLNYPGVVVMLLMVGFRLSAQNLVPNPGFELYNDCPWSFNSMPYTPGYDIFPTVTDWTTPVKFSSPDYMNTCAPANSGLQIPQPAFGYQQPHSGNAYAGIIAWEGRMLNGSIVLDYREYLQARLKEPLQAGKQYCVSFYVSPTADPFFHANYVAIDEVGVNFSVARTTDTQKFTLSIPFHVKNKAGIYITDTSRWYKISGNYIATGGEEWITIGCFSTGTFPQYIPVMPPQPAPGLDYRTYMYVDDVEVREMVSSDTIIHVHDTIVCLPTGNQIQLASASGAAGSLWNTGVTAASIVAGDTGTYWCISPSDCGFVADTFHIGYQEPRVLNMGGDTLNCAAQPIVLQAPPGYHSYLWSTGATTATLTAQVSGTYILKVEDVCGVQTDTIEVTIQAPTPPPLVRDTVICQFDHNPTLQVTGENLLWYTIHSGIPGIPNQPYIYAHEPGMETLFVSQTIGQCESPRVPVNIRVRMKPDVTIGDYISICPNTDTLIGRPYDDMFYIWNTGETVCCIRPQYTGTYTLTIANDCGSATDTAFVDISDCNECLFMPNAFTPNNDGRNDWFLPVVACPVADYKMQVLNRWGQVVFSTHELSRGWNGGQADMGVYIYLVEYRSETTGRHHSLRGNLTLIR